ncbi:MAG: hypothetical protein Q8910_00730 [Bacteroidota bacterium]|nr:hypothetical protein [Bacteroidota bacterium]
MDKGKGNGVQWDDHNDEGVNWFRFSRALINHLDADKPFYVDDTDNDTLKNMHDHYVQLRSLHVKTMMPHVKEGLRHLQDKDVNSHKHPNEYLPQVYQHLAENGGHHWADKVRTLVHMNNRIKVLKQRLNSKGIEV